MYVKVTTHPTPLVSLDEAKVALGESGTDRDALIGGLILAAQAELDGPSGWVGISVARQEVEVLLDCFTDCIRLPAGPVIAPVVVTYLDENGVQQTLSNTIYTLLNDGRLVRSPNQSWPRTYGREEAVTLAYAVGIEDEADPRIALMKTAIILHVRMMLDQDDTEKRRQTINWLVSPLRVWGA